MTHRNLGKSGVRVSTVARGCMSLGADRSRARRIIRKALDPGVTLFDTADLYDHGVNEQSSAPSRFQSDRLPGEAVGAHP
jgi:aryl-alcohol dehydrogenase-like predicted oxidoreductase